MDKQLYKKGDVVKYDEGGKNSMAIVEILYWTENSVDGNYRIQLLNDSRFGIKGENRMFWLYGDSIVLPLYNSPLYQAMNEEETND